MTAAIDTRSDFLQDLYNDRKKIKEGGGREVVRGEKKKKKSCL